MVVFRLDELPRLVRERVFQFLGDGDRFKHIQKHCDAKTRVSGFPTSEAGEALASIMTSLRRVAFVLGYREDVSESAIQALHGKTDSKLITQHDLRPDLIALNRNAFQNWHNGVIRIVKQAAEKVSAQVAQHMNEVEWWPSSHMCGQFFVVADRNDGTIVISNDKSRVYLVQCPYGALGKVLQLAKQHASLPCSALLTLFPFAGQIVCEGLTSEPIEMLSEEVAAQLLQVYTSAAAQGRLITCFSPRPVPLRSVEPTQERQNTTSAKPTRPLNAQSAHLREAAQPQLPKLTSATRSSALQALPFLQMHGPPTVPEGATAAAAMLNPFRRKLWLRMRGLRKPAAAEGALWAMCTIITPAQDVAGGDPPFYLDVYDPQACPIALPNIANAHPTVLELFDAVCEGIFGEEAGGDGKGFRCPYGVVIDEPTALAGLQRLLHPVGIYVLHHERPMNASGLPYCANCEVTAEQLQWQRGALKRCARCKWALYCSRDCQKEHYAEHRKVCK